MNILLFIAHSIEEYDQVRLLTALGHNVFSPGAYIDPEHPLDDMRPPLRRTQRNWFPELKTIVDNLPIDDDHPDRLDTAKQQTPPELLEWADVLIVHHLEHRWVWPQWDRIQGKDVRVIWRTVGQSAHPNEYQAQAFVKRGLQIVRYSPLEANIPNYAGANALVRFYKDAGEYGGWTGDEETVLWVAQNPAERRMWVHTDWMLNATRGLPVTIVGPQSEAIGGKGKVTPEHLKELLRRSRAVLYTGTQPACYTLGLIEAMMTGAPVVSIGPERFTILPYGRELYEGHLLAPMWASTAAEAHDMLAECLGSLDYSREVSEVSRARALALWSRERAEAGWRAVLAERWTKVPGDPEDMPSLEA